MTTSLALKIIAEQDRGQEFNHAMVFLTDSGYFGRTRFDRSDRLTIAEIIVQPKQ